MRVKIRLQDVGVKRSRYYYLVVQPKKKKLQGLALERVGVWLPRTTKTVPRQVSLNTHRLKYWLSVGAEPSTQVHRLISKFGILPPLPPKFGTTHSYQKPEKSQPHTHFRGLGGQRQHAHKHGHRLAFYYKQKIQEEVNLVQRRQRLAAELLANQGGKVGDAPSAINNQAEDTDGYESEDPDIFRRTENFKKILNKMDEHRKENLLTFKGNDLRYNVYLKKLQKLSRKDLGLDILGYKDYVNNLKEFAHVNKDLNIFATESLATGDSPKQRGMVSLSYQPDIDQNLEGAERVQNNSQSILWTLKKLLRTGRSWISDRDRRAVRELDENMRLYLVNDDQILFNLRHLFVRAKRDELEKKKHMETIKELTNDVSVEILENANVSMREYKQIKLLIDLNINIFEEESRIHVQHDLITDNPFNHFVDFSKLPADKTIPKQAKDVLYRPERMAKLNGAYRRLVQELENDFLKRKHETQIWRENKAKQLKWADRIPGKPQEELQMIAQLVKRVETDFELTEDQMVHIKKEQTDASAPIKTYTNHLDWYKPTLQKLIDERRKIPKEERLKLYREDEIDAVDTTDLENWSLKGSFVGFDPTQNTSDEAEEAYKHGYLEDEVVGRVRDQRFKPEEKPEPKGLEFSEKEEKEFGQEVMEQILNETGEAEIESKTVRSFKSTNQKQSKTQDSKGLADEVKKAATSRDIGKDVDDVQVIDKKNINDILANDPVYKGIVVDEGFPKVMTEKEAISNMINEQSIKDQLEGTAKKFKFEPEGERFFKEEQYGDVPLFATREMALRSAGVIASTEDESDLEMLNESDETDPDALLENLKRISEQRILREPTTMREMFEQIINFEGTSKSIQKPSQADIELNNEFYKLLQEGEDYKGDAEKILEKVDHQLNLASLHIQGTPKMPKSDREFLMDNIIVDKPRTIKLLKVLIHKARQEFDLESGSDLAYHELGLPSEDIDYENWEKPKTKDNSMQDYYRSLQGKEDSAESEAEAAEMQGPQPNLRNGLKTYPGCKITQQDQVFFEVNTAAEFRRIVQRHRLDLSKLLFEKDGGYSLRQFKQIYLKEIKENPDKYFIDRAHPDYHKQYSYGENALAWRNNPLNYANFIKQQSPDEIFAQSVGLTAKSKREAITKKLIQKAIDSGILESKIGSQFEEAAPFSKILNEALAAASGKIQDMKLQNQLDNLFNGKNVDDTKKGEAEELLDTYQNHGYIAVQKLMMVRFCEKLSQKDLETFVTPFMAPKEQAEIQAMKEDLKQTEDQDAKEELVDPAESTAAAEPPAEIEVEGQSEAAAAEGESDQAGMPQTVEPDEYGLDERDLALMSRFDIKEEDLDKPHPWDAKLKESQLPNLDLDTADGKLMREGINETLSYMEFDESKMTFKQKSELYQVTQFPNYVKYLSGMMWEILMDPETFDQNYDYNFKQELIRAGITQDVLQKRKDDQEKAEKDLANEQARDMIKIHNEQAKEDKNVRFITEEELEEILDKMWNHKEEWDMSDDEAVEEYFEKQFEKITKEKQGAGFPIYTKGSPLERGPWEALHRDKSQEYQSLVHNKWVTDKQQKRNIHESLVERLQRYPQGFRQYENYAVYSQVHKDASIEDYMKEMNRQVEFSEFMAIMTAHVKEQLATPEGHMLYKNYLEKRFGSVNIFGDEDVEIDPADELDPTKRERFKDSGLEPEMANIVYDFDNFVQTDFYINECRSQYAQRVQGFLVNKQVYSMVECLEECVDFMQLGVHMWELPVANAYIPVKNTIMKKPDLRAGVDEDFGFRHYDVERERDTTRQRFGPLDQLSPLGGHRMAPGYPKLRRTLGPESEAKPSWPKWRRLSHHASWQVGASRSKALFSTVNKQEAPKYQILPSGIFGGVQLPRKFTIPPLNESPFRKN